MWPFVTGFFRLHDVSKMNLRCSLNHFFIPSVAKQTQSCEYTPSIRSSLNKHLGCFHFLTIVNTAVSFKYKFLCRHRFFVFLAIYRGVELLPYMVTECWTFSGTLDSFQKWLHLVTLPPTLGDGSHFSMSSRVLAGPRPALPLSLIIA